MARARPTQLHPDAHVVTYDGRSYQVWAGGVLLDWRNKKMLYHKRGCQLCCENHPWSGDCGNCGAGWSGRRPDLCRLCHRTAHFRDDDGPIHKSCLERAVLAAAGQRGAR